MNLVCDLDGTVWLDGKPLAGAVAAIAAARAEGHRVLFCTNNSTLRPDQIAGKLEAVGIPADGDVVSSSDAVAGLVMPGERVYVIGKSGIRNAVTGRGAVIVDGDDAGTADVVAVGRDTAFDWEMLVLANRAIRNGARFVATNDDLTFPTPQGLEPGIGALLAAITAASGVTPTVAGKPYAPMADVIRARLGADWDAGNTAVIGDLQSTDGLFAVTLGVPFALVLSGVTASAAGLVPQPQFVSADLAEFIYSHVLAQPQLLSA